MARLDAAMVQQGLVPSRQRAKTLIQNGQISVNGKVCTKPAFAVEETDQITMEGSDIPFVGRGGDGTAGCDWLCVRNALEL